MTEKEQFLKLLNKVLFYSEELIEELEQELNEVENPKISTDISKQAIIEDMRLVNSIKFVGEKVKGDLEAQSRKKIKKNK